ESISNLTWRFTNTQLGYLIYKNYFLGRMFEASEKVIAKEKADIIISAYPLTCTILQAIKLKRYKFKYAVVITNLISMHRSLADFTSDLIVCPTIEAVPSLVSFRVSKEKIIYPFFPIKPGLVNFRNKEEVIKELGFKSDLPIILLTGGGLGT